MHKQAVTASRHPTRLCSTLLTRRSGSDRLHTEPTVIRLFMFMHDHRQEDDSVSIQGPLANKQESAPSNVHSLHIAPCSRSTSATSGWPV